METLAGIVGPIVLLVLVTVVPLAILRSLDEIKASQRRIEAHLSDLASSVARQDAIT